MRSTLQEALDSSYIGLFQEHQVTTSLKLSDVQDRNEYQEAPEGGRILLVYEAYKHELFTFGGKIYSRLS